MSTPASEKTIVLVHGAFADASGWQHVIPLLLQEGYKVIAVQNALTGLADDVATTKRVLDAQTGPTVAVGHSYGGAVITGAATGVANVKALVYIAAFAPDSNALVTVGAENFAAPDLNTSLVPDAAGYLYIGAEKFHATFCADVDADEATIMQITQKPLNSAAFGESVGAAAWETIPSWYLVAKNDHAINPDYERFLANRIGAQTSEVDSSHVPFISQPQVVADLIKAAADSI